MSLSQRALHWLNDILPYAVKCRYDILPCARRFSVSFLMIREWFTVHHVIDLKGLLVYSFLISSKKNLNDSGVKLPEMSSHSSFSQSYSRKNRPYALMSHLHNNDAMLGVKTCRAARMCCAGRVLALSRCAGPGRPGGMACRVWPAGCMLGDGARDSASFDPQHAGAPFCDVICIRSITTVFFKANTSYFQN